MDALWSRPLHQLNLYFRAEQQIVVLAPSQRAWTEVWRKAAVVSEPAHDGALAANRLIVPKHCEKADFC